jgi:predicted trehalose synthase
VLPAAIAARTYAHIGRADVSWHDLSRANRARAARDPRTTRSLVATAADQSLAVGRTTRALHASLAGVERPGRGPERGRDRVEDAVAELILTMDLLAERWAMDLARALAQLFNERGIREGERERINPRIRRT